MVLSALKTVLAGTNPLSALHWMVLVSCGSERPILVTGDDREQTIAEAKAWVDKKLFDHDAQSG